MIDFPIFDSKKLSDGKTYNLSDPAERRLYFKAKLGGKIEALKTYLDQNTFLAFLLAKKGAGKGTYAGMFKDIFGEERVAHISVGDIVRDVHKALEDPNEKEKIVGYMQKEYRGFLSIDDSIQAILNRTQSKLSVPTEFMLALIKREVEKIGRKAIFLDGFPRNLDQISYSLYFRNLINMRDDPDILVLFDVPESILDARIKTRVVCPLCNISRNTMVNPTKYVEYDKRTKKYYLICDNESCAGYKKQRLGKKEGDELGIEAIRDRLETDGKLVEMATNLVGIPVVYIRNSIPVSKASIYAEDYEITPEYYYECDKDGKNVKILQRPWVVRDDKGVESYSLLAAPVVASLVSQLHDVLLG